MKKNQLKYSVRAILIVAILALSFLILQEIFSTKKTNDPMRTESPVLVESDQPYTEELNRENDSENNVEITAEIKKLNTNNYEVLVNGTIDLSAINLVYVIENVEEVEFIPDSAFELVVENKFEAKTYKITLATLDSSKLNINEEGKLIVGNFKTDSEDAIFNISSESSISIDTEIYPIKINTI